MEPCGGVWVSPKPGVTGLNRSGPLLAVPPGPPAGVPALATPPELPPIGGVAAPAGRPSGPEVSRSREILPSSATDPGGIESASVGRGAPPGAGAADHAGETAGPAGRPGVVDGTDRAAATAASGGMTGGLTGGAVAGAGAGVENSSGTPGKVGVPGAEGDGCSDWARPPGAAAVVARVTAGRVGGFARATVGPSRSGWSSGGYQLPSEAFHHPSAGWAYGLASRAPLAAASG